MSKLNKAEQATWDALNKDYNKFDWPGMKAMLEGYKQGELHIIASQRRTGKSQMTAEFFKKMYEGNFTNE